MKNFPHQFSQLGKLTGALRVALEVSEGGGDIGDDGDYGTALALGEIYTFRNEGDIEELIAREQRKPRSSQGSRTAARDVRRLLSLCGFLSSDDDGWAITERGRELLAEANDAVLRALWREAMLALPLAEEDGPVSHPYRILLRLVRENPGIETKKLMLALEAEDDTEEEFERVNELAQGTFRQIATGLGLWNQETAAPKAQVSNAIKILPAIAEQVRDIIRQNPLVFPVGAPPVAEDGGVVLQAGPVRQGHPARRVSAATIARVPDFQPIVQGAAARDFTATIALQQRRTIQHQALVSAFAEHLVRAGYDLYEDPFDCLAIRSRKGLLIEAKTLDGSPVDERRQAEKALGQILGYYYFDIPDRFRALQLHLIILFSASPIGETIDFLNKSGMSVMWPDGDGWLWFNPQGTRSYFRPRGRAD